MHFLTIDGHTFDVANMSGERMLKSRGRRSRAYLGQMRNQTRGQRRQLRFRACFKDHEEAESLVHVINGEGHVVKFVDGWEAATGLQPDVGDLSLTRFDATTTPFTGFPAGSFFTEGDGLLLRYDPQFSDPLIAEGWTLLYWYKIDTAAWSVIAKRSDGAAWVDGVRNDAAWDANQGSFQLFVVDGRVSIFGTGGDPTRLHHLCMLPYVAHENLILSWQSNLKPWGSNPLLRVEGDALLTDHEFFFGEVLNVATISKPSEVAGFGWVNNAEIVEFSLMEYATTFVSDPSVPT